MKRACGSCGVEYEAKRAVSRFCSDRCRKRAQRGHVGPVVDLPVRVVPEPADGLVSAVKRRLGDAGQVDSPLGQTALALALRIERPSLDSGSAVAALSRELRATLVEALRGVGAPTSVVTSHKDELAARRRA